MQGLVLQLKQHPKCTVQKPQAVLMKLTQYPTRPTELLLLLLLLLPAGELHGAETRAIYILAY
jgi:hypothetical protein